MLRPVSPFLFDAAYIRRMLLKYFIKDREKRRQFAHIGAAIVIFIHAYHQFETGHGSPIVFIVAGTLFLAIALLHPLVEKKAPWIDGVFFVIEGILSIVVAFDYFHLHKKALPAAHLLLAFIQFYMAFKKSKKGIQHHQLHPKL